MPARIGRCPFRLRKVVDVDSFLSRSQRWSLARIETDTQNVKILTGLQRHGFKRSNHSVQDLRTKHWTVVVNQRQDSRPFPEVTPELHVCSGFIFEAGVDR